MMKLEKSIISIIMIITVALLLTGCSYVSNSIEEEFSERSSFTGEATYDGTHVTITWDDSDSDVGDVYDIFITSEPNDEFSDYEHIPPTPTCTSSPFIYTFNPPAARRGIYFFRIAKFSRNDKNELVMDEVSAAIKVLIY